jgi:hypothetical protein
MPITKAFVQRGDHGEIMGEPSYVFWNGARLLGLDIEFFEIPHRGLQG